MAIRDFDQTQINWLCEFTVHCEPHSKANSRRMVTNKKTGKLIPIKSKKALVFMDAMKRDCPTLDPLLEGDLSIAVEIFYATRRPDLDESLILDAMQGAVFVNDRQIKEKHIYHNLDRTFPRAEIKIAAL